MKRRPQDEIENLIRNKFGHLPGYDDTETIFYPLSEIVYRPENIAENFIEYSKTIFLPPEPPVSIDALKADISGFLRLYRLDGHAMSVAQTAIRIQDKFELPEVYALPIGFLVETAELVQNEAGMRDAAFVCARHLGDSYTGMVRGLLDFDLWKPILSDEMKHILQLYLTTLEKEFHGTIPPEWLYTK